MRISTLLFNERISNEILNRQSEMAETQLQLSTGRQILRPSDDPISSKQALDVQKFLDTTNQYQKNIDIVRGRLELEETVLAESMDVLQRLNELALQANTDTYTATDKGLIAEEVDQLLGELVAIANTRDSNDEYLFSGFQRETKPIVDAGGGVYQYQGDQGQRLIHIAADRKVADAETGFEAFMDIPASGGGTNNLFSMVYDLAANMRADADLAADIDNIRNALDNVTQVRTKAGARLASTEQQEGVNEDFILHFEMELSSLQDLDYAEAITRFNRQTTALQAAQQSYVQIQGLSLFDYIR